MSQYFLAKYRPVADALLCSHSLSVPDATRDMLANTICHNRELAQAHTKLRGSRSALPTLRTAKTHAMKLIEYAQHPPTRASSIALHRTKLAKAIRTNDIAILDLGIVGIDPDGLLASLDAGGVTLAMLRRLARVIDKIEAQHEKERREGGGIGRPWAPHTPIIRVGCIAWRHAGCRIGYQWNDGTATLAGVLPDFLRDLVACCAGTHVLMRVKPRAVPFGYRNPTSPPRGNVLRSRTPDRVIRDGIRAWQAWSKEHPAKTHTFSA